MNDVLHSVGSLSNVLSEVMKLFQLKVENTESTHRQISGQHGFQPWHADTQLPPFAPPSLVGGPSSLSFIPARFAWLGNIGDGASNYSGDGGGCCVNTSHPTQLVLLKRVLNGVVSYFTNRAFEMLIISKDTLQSAWASTGRPCVESFLHPNDAPVLCSHVRSLWDGLQGGKGGTTEAATSLTASSSSSSLSSSCASTCGSGCGDPLRSEKTCARDLAAPVRVWASRPSGGTAGYVLCSVRVQLVVTTNSDGQASHVAFAFRPAQRSTKNEAPPSTISAVPPLTPNW
jgi:hypothetical protein